MSCTRATSLSNVLYTSEWGESDSETRPRSAPSSPDAGRKLLPSRLRSSRPKKRFHYGTSKSLMKPRSSKSRPSTMARSRPSTMGGTSLQDSMHTMQQRPQSVTIVRTPGYTLCRSPTSVKMNINTRQFFGDKQDNSAQISKKSSPSASAVLEASLAAAMEKAMQVEQALQVETAEMHIKIEDQKQLHKKEIIELEGNFEKEKTRLAKAHEAKIGDIKRDHDRELTFLHSHYAEQKKEMQLQHETVVADLNETLEYTKELLQTTTLNLEKEAEERLEHRENELKTLHASEIEEVKFNMKEENKIRLSELEKEMAEKHQQQVEELKNEHEEEVKVLLAQFNEMRKLEKKLAHSNKQVKKLEKETSKLKIQLKQANSEQLNAEAQLLETQQRLEKFESNYQENVKAVQSNYKGRLDTLMQENAQLRKRLMHKTDQFCDYQATMEKHQTQTVRDFRDKVQVVVRARCKAHLSVATDMGLECNDHSAANDKAKRPSSAPSTRRESMQAKNQVRDRTALTQKHKTSSMHTQAHTASYSSPSSSVQGKLQQ